MLIFDIFEHWLLYYLVQDTNGKVTTLQLDTTNKSQENQCPRIV